MMTSPSVSLTAYSSELSTVQLGRALATLYTAHCTVRTLATVQFAHALATVQCGGEAKKEDALRRPLSRLQLDV